jgi:hypothetical protein
MNNKFPARGNGQKIKTRSQMAAALHSGSKAKEAEVQRDRASGTVESAVGRLERRTGSSSETTSPEHGMTPHPEERSAPTISAREIAKRAYEKFAGRGHLHGFDHEDWAAAEAELLAEAGWQTRN